LKIFNNGDPVDLMIYNKIRPAADAPDCPLRCGISPFIGLDQEEAMKRHLRSVHIVSSFNLELYCAYCLFGRPTFNLPLF
jgi:hypothetical protein